MNLHVTLENFGARVDWIAEHCTVTDDYRAWIADPNAREKASSLNRLPFETRTDVWYAVKWARKLIDRQGTWDHCCTGQKLAGGRRRRIPREFVLGLERVFPELGDDVLRVESFDEFKRRTEDLTAARKRWLAAEWTFRTDRWKLEGVARRYYEGVDQFRSNCPLIVREGWLLEHPQRLSARDVLPEWETRIVDPVAPRLPGLTCDWSDIKARLAPRDHPPVNRESYRLLGVNRKGDELAFKFGPSSYFRCVNSLEARGAELADNLAQGRTSYDSENWPLRSAPETAFDFWNRSAVAGVNCLTILKNYQPAKSNNRHVFLIHKRAQNVLEAQNAFHVVPAGTHQPVNNFGDPDELRIWNTAVREFCEELFNMEKAISAIKPGCSIRDLTQVDNVIRKFFEISGSNTVPASEIYLLGLGLDPITTKPEIATVMVVDCSLVDVEIKEHHEGAWRAIPLSKANLLSWVDPPGDDNHMLPAGAVCLQRTAALYDEIMTMFDARK